MADASEAPGSSSDLVPFYISIGAFLVMVLNAAFQGHTSKDQGHKDQGKERRASRLSQGKDADVSLDAENADQAEEEFIQHFAGGKSFGPVLLFLTFFSSLYSGVTVVGIPQIGSGIGFIVFMIAIGFQFIPLFQCILLPRLRRLSKARNWIAHQDPIIDIYGNRLVSILFTLMAVFQQWLYCVIQFYSAQGIISAITLDQIDAKALTWALVILMVFAEMSGGLTSVVLTDAIQAGVMLVGMVSLPIMMLINFGPLGDSVGADCANLETLNCTAGTYLHARGAACAAGSGIVKNGCLMLPNICPWGVLQPAHGLSEFFKPIWRSMDGLNYPEYKCKDQWGNFTGAMCQNTADPSNVNPATMGIDGVWIFNYVPMSWCFFIFFCGFNALFPQVSVRYYAAKSANALKKSMIAATISVAITAIPFCILGLVVKANLLQKYPKGTTAFGVAVHDMLTRGGVNAFCGTTLAIAALSAMMSTADSAVISATTMLTNEFLKNWLFVKYPSLYTATTLKAFACSCSIVIIVSSAAYAMYDEDVNDPDTDTYIMLSQQSSALLLMTAVPILCGVFLPKASDWAVMAGFIAGFTVWLALDQTVGHVRIAKKDAADYPAPGRNFSPFNDNDIKHIGMKSYEWGAIVCMVVGTTFSMFPLRKFSTPMILQHNTRAYDPYGECLTYDKIKEAMKDTQEIWKDKIGLPIIIWVAVSSMFTSPFWGGPSWGGCTYFSYIAWFMSGADISKPAADGCAGVELCMGIPCWVMPVFVLFPINLILLCVAFTRWQSPEGAENDGEVGETRAFRASLPSQENVRFSVQDIDVSLKPAGEKIGGDLRKAGDGGD